MGLILDTSVLIAEERRGGSPRQLVKRLQDIHGNTGLRLSSVSVVELTHGIFRAKTSQQSERRRVFADKLFRDIAVEPLSLEIAKLAGQIEGEQASKGIVIAFEDLVIGATALHLGYGVVTLNVRHFEKIPGLRVVTI